MSRDYDREERYVTCPRCGGSGKNNDTLDCNCYLCQGTKRVPKSEANRYKDY